MSNNYPESYISFAQTIYSIEKEKIELWAKGDSELATACKNVIKAARAKQ